MQNKPSTEMPVLPSAGTVVSQSSRVFFHPEMIGPAISRWGGLLESAPAWEHPCHFFDGTAETVRWIFTLDVLNHCFWAEPGEPVWTVRYLESDWSGYWALAASLKRAVESGFPVTDPIWLSRVGEKDLRRIFAGSGEIPLFSERLRNLREAGSVIVSDLGGDITSLLQEASGSAVELVLQLVARFPSFRDEADYKGRRVFFWKRAQIFAADLFAAFGGRGPGGFHDIERLTAFADYKLPQVLREMGIISYNPDLSGQVDALRHIGPGSEAEVEIRAMTIVAVDEIRRAFERGGKRAASAEVDGWLWRLGQMDAFRGRPYHRCRTIYY